jgi:hypothetical protein
MWGLFGEVWIIICCGDELITDLHTVITLFLHKNSWYVVLIDVIYLQVLPEDGFATTNWNLCIPCTCLYCLMTCHSSSSFCDAAGYLLNGCSSSSQASWTCDATGKLFTIVYPEHPYLLQWWESLMLSHFSRQTISLLQDHQVYCAVLCDLSHLLILSGLYLACLLYCHIIFFCSVTLNTAYFLLSWNCRYIIFYFLLLFLSLFKLVQISHITDTHYMSFS